MDTLSHAAWGWAIFRASGFPRRASISGAVAGALPDLAFWAPWAVDRILAGDPGGAVFAGDPSRWRADGPPLPAEWLVGYERYYTFSHSLVVAMVAFGVASLIARAFSRHRGLAGFVMLLFVPYAFHIFLDLPFHERFHTPILWPLSDWTVHGIHWARPEIFFPHLVLLVAALVLVEWRRRRAIDRSEIDGPAGSKTSPS